MTEGGGGVVGTNPRISRENVENTDFLQFRPVGENMDSRLVPRWTFLVREKLELNT